MMTTDKPAPATCLRLRRSLLPLGYSHAPHVGSLCRVVGAGSKAGMVTLESGPEMTGGVGVFVWEMGEGEIGKYFEEEPIRS